MKEVRKSYPTNEWDVIHYINWYNTCKCTSRSENDHVDICKENLFELGISNNDKLKLQDFVHRHRLALENVLRGFSLGKYRDYSFPGVSDDSLWDLTAHIVGCGQCTYELIMRNPEVISYFMKGYRENFEYVFSDAK